MNLIRITEDNLAYAVSIQEELFPGESARVNYEESPESVKFIRQASLDSL